MSECMEVSGNDAVGPAKDETSEDGSCAPLLRSTCVSVSMPSLLQSVCGRMRVKGVRTRGDVGLPHRYSTLAPRQHSHRLAQGHNGCKRTHSLHPVAQVARSELTLLDHTRLRTILITRRRSTSLQRLLLSPDMFYFTATLLAAQAERQGRCRTCEAPSLTPFRPSSTRLTQHPPLAGPQGRGSERKGREAGCRQRGEGGGEVGEGSVSSTFDAVRSAERGSRRYRAHRKGKSSKEDKAAAAEAARGTSPLFPALSHGRLNPPCRTHSKESRTRAPPRRRRSLFAFQAQSCA